MQKNKKQKLDKPGKGELVSKMMDNITVVRSYLSMDLPLTVSQVSLSSANRFSRCCLSWLVWALSWRLRPFFDVASYMGLFDLRSFWNSCRSISVWRKTILFCFCFCQNKNNKKCPLYWLLHLLLSQLLLDLLVGRGDLLVCVQCLLHLCQPVQEEAPWLIELKFAIWDRFELTYN